MPIYEYKCCQCGHKFEEIVSINQKEDLSCPSCGAAKIKKCVSPFGISGVSNKITSDSCSSCSSGSCKTCS